MRLHAERKSPQTVKSYTAGVQQFLAWWAAQDAPAVLDRATVNAFIAGMLDSGAQAAHRAVPATGGAPVLGMVRRGGRDRPGQAAGPQAAAHRLACTPALWLGDRGKSLSYDGLYAALKYRAELAGIPDFHPHVTRHTAAQRWLSAEGSEGGLMAVAGWTRRDMIDRYTRATASEQVAEEARRLGLGDF